MEMSPWSFSSILKNGWISKTTCLSTTGGLFDPKNLAIPLFALAWFSNVTISGGELLNGDPPLSGSFVFPGLVVRGQLVHPAATYRDLSLWSYWTNSITRCQFSDPRRQIVFKHSSIHHEWEGINPFICCFWGAIYAWEIKMEEQNTCLIGSNKKYRTSRWVCDSSRTSYFARLGTPLISEIVNSIPKFGLCCAINSLLPSWERSFTF